MHLYNALHTSHRWHASHASHAVFVSRTNSHHMHHIACISYCNILSYAIISYHYHTAILLSYHTAILSPIILSSYHSIIQESNHPRIQSSIHSYVHTSIHIHASMIHTSIHQFTYIHTYTSIMYAHLGTWTLWIQLHILVQFATRKGIRWCLALAFPLNRRYRSPQRRGQSWHSCPQHWMVSRLRSNRQNPAFDATAHNGTSQCSTWDILWLGSAMPMHALCNGLLMSPCV